MRKIKLACLLLIFVQRVVLGTHDVYIVTMEGDPVVSYRGGVEGFPATAVDLDEEMDVTSEAVTSYAFHLRGHHDKLLDSLLVEGTYEKLYSYHHLINGFAVHMSSLQAEFLRKAPGVKHVERDIKAVQDGVDILNLSVGPNSPPTTTRTTFLNPFDAALLSAVKAGVFVAQAAGNGGPFPKTLVSFSPWISTVAAGVDDRRYKNHLTLGNGKLISGLGVSTYNTWEYVIQPDFCS